MRDVSKSYWVSFVSIGLIGFFLAYIVVVQEPLNSDAMRPPLLTSLSSRASSILSKQVYSARQFIPALQRAAPGPSAFSPSQSPIHVSSRSIMNKSIKDAVEYRRSVYQLQKKSPISDAQIQEIVTTALKTVPSSFNAQSTRLVVLLKDEHDKFWDIVRDILKAMVPEDKWESTAKRIGGFRGGYGSVSRTLGTTTIFAPVPKVLSR